MSKTVEFRAKVQAQKKIAIPKRLLDFNEGDLLRVKIELIENEA